ncbi:SPOSA6832_03353 [Sporobolomyces salmonicolor]|uniref:U three protein 7 n=1 Tax=Sporidiobolus salmonicolor TaxID=5005 RepID=A0A0D6ENY4_SPOSA|nr:SPOSA6832_03353 [Sporobolomyces salmonicolor]
MAAPQASTSALNRTPSRKGKGKALDQDAPESLLSNSRSLPQQDQSYVPPAQELKKYLYAKPHILSKHSNPKKHKDKKLGHHLAHLSSTAKASSLHAFEHDHLLLNQDSAGLIEAENDLERTWRVTQREIVDSSAVGVEGKQFSLTLDEFGPYAVDYTRNGRHLAIAGRKGHVGTFDWQSGRLHTELQLQETTRAIRWLHDESFFAVAQKKYVYIYDRSGLEVHQLRNHIEVNQMEFLPYHFLLATIGNPGYLKYQDTSTGQLVAEHRTKLGSCDVMAQNPHNAFIHLGHQNGTVTLWSPSVSTAQVKLLAHSSPVSSIAVDPSSLGTRMVTTGIDGSVKIWDTRKWAVLNEYHFKKTPKTTAWSQKGLLGVGWGNHISVFNDLTKPSHSARLPPPPYLTHTFPSTPVHSLKFCPFDDLLGVGHARGFTSLLVPGAGEPNFDSLEADPFEGKRRRREREVHQLLEKLPMDLITLDQDVLGKVDRGVLRAREAENPHAPGFRATPFAQKTRIDRLKEQGEAAVDEDESTDEDEDEGDVEGRKRAERAQRRLDKADAKKRMRGKTSGIKKALRKRRRNVIDPQTVALKEKLERNRQKAQQVKQNKLAAQSAASGTAGALDRFGF